MNAYEVKAGILSLQCDPCLSVSESSFSQWGATEIYLSLGLHAAACSSSSSRLVVVVVIGLVFTVMLTRT